MDCKENNMSKKLFDYVIGNPPYQENIENRSEQPPIYHFFYDAAISVSKCVEYITPARFLFDAGKTPSVWNKKMLNDTHFKVLMYEQNSQKIFANTDIKGGVAITVRNENKNYGKIETFIHFDELKTIREKVKTDKNNNFSNLIFSNTSYKYTPLFFNENDGFDKRVSGGSKRYLSSSVFEKFPEVFFENKPEGEYATIIGLKNLKRKRYFFKKAYLNPPTNFDKFKVIVPASNGSGAIGEVLSTPLIGEPLIGHTETFISIGSFDTIEEADNCLKYIKSKFARTLLGIKKITQGNKKAETWSEIPLQDFTSNSDIDWSKSIHEIDLQLYKKYGLDEKEIEFIETHVKEMN